MIPSSYPDQPMIMYTMLQTANWARDGLVPATVDMGVNHRGVDASMPHQILDGWQAPSAWQAKQTGVAHPQAGDDLSIRWAAYPHNQGILFNIAVFEHAPGRCLSKLNALPPMGENQH
jgi:hypothetical protein